MICPEINLRLGSVVSRNRARQWALGMLIGLFGVNLTLGGWMAVLQQDNKVLQEILELQESRNRSSHEYKNYQEVQAKDQAVQKNQVLLVNKIIQEDAFSWTQLLERLEQTLVPGVRLVSLNPNVGSNNLKVTGQAQTPAQLRRYLDSLFQSPWFQETYISRQTQKDQKKSEVSSFPVDFNLEIQQVF